MIRKIAMAGLLFGAVAGFSSSFGKCRAAREERRSSFEAHIADVCVAAAQRQAAKKIDAAPAEQGR